MYRQRVSSCFKTVSKDSFAKPKVTSLSISSQKTNFKDVASSVDLKLQTSDQPLHIEELKSSVEQFYIWQHNIIEKNSATEEMISQIAAGFKTFDNQLVTLTWNLLLPHQIYQSLHPFHGILDTVVWDIIYFLNIISG